MTSRSQFTELQNRSYVIILSQKGIKTIFGRHLLPLLKMSILQIDKHRVRQRVRACLTAAAVLRHYIIMDGVAKFSNGCSTLLGCIHSGETCTRSGWTSASWVKALPFLKSNDIGFLWLLRIINSSCTQTMTNDWNCCRYHRAHDVAGGRTLLLGGCCLRLRAISHRAMFRGHANAAR